MTMTIKGKLEEMTLPITWLKSEITYYEEFPFKHSRGATLVSYVKKKCRFVTLLSKRVNNENEIQRKLEVANFYYPNFT